MDRQRGVYQQWVIFESFYLSCMCVESWKKFLGLVLFVETGRGHATRSIHVRIWEFAYCQMRTIYMQVHFGVQVRTSSGRV